MASRFVGGGGLPVSSGLVAWYAADQISGLSNGDPVVTWKDGSGNGNDASQNTQAAQPTYQTNQINGRPALSFDGTDDTLKITSVNLVGADGTWTCYAVAQTTGGAGTQSIANYDNGNTARIARLLRFNPASPRLEAVAFNTVPTSFTDGSPAYAAGWHIGRTVRATATLEVFLDGTSNGALATTGTAASGASIFEIGSALGGSFLTGSIAELVIYNRALSASEQSQIDHYLSSKYGIAVSD